MLQQCSRWLVQKKTVGGEGLEYRLLLKSIPKVRVGIVQMLEHLYMVINALSLFKKHR